MVGDSPDLLFLGVWFSLVFYVRFFSLVFCVIFPWCLWVFLGYFFLGFFAVFHVSVVVWLQKQNHILPEDGFC